MVVLLITQILFTFTTLWAKYNLLEAENFASSLQESWLVIYVIVYVIATFMQLYVFKITNIFKAMSFFSGIALILTVTAGYILFDEMLDWRDITSIVLVLSSLFIIGKEKEQQVQK